MAAEDERLQRLFEKAGARPSPPAADLESIKAAFRAAWEESVGTRQARLALGPILALAASLLFIVGLGVWWSARPSSEAVAFVARVETLEGVVEVSAPEEPGARGTRLALGAGIAAGARLETAGADEGAAPGRAAIRLAGGSSLRLDAGTRMRLVSDEILELERGAVYVDSGSNGKPIEVRTPIANATDIGTQFEVRLLEADTRALRVRVRRGEVSVKRQEKEISVGPDSEMTLGEDGAVARAQLLPYGPEWDWVVEIAPRFQADGRTTREFLDWVAQETGWRVRFADRDAEAIAVAAVLSGDVVNFDAYEAPAAVLPAAGLVSTAVDGTLVVSRGANLQR